MLFVVLLIAFAVCLVGVSAKRANEAAPVKRRASKVVISPNPGSPKRRALGLPSGADRGVVKSTV